MSEEQRKVVLGLGNLLYGDEGLGIHALKALAARLGPGADVELIDGGVLGLSLLPLVEECSHLLLLDAANTGKAPGTLIELPREQIPLYSGVKLSDHQVTFQEVLGLAAIRGHLPEHLYLVGAQPATLAVGIDLSPTVADVLPQVVERALAILHDWHVMS